MSDVKTYPWPGLCIGNRWWLFHEISTLFGAECVVLWKVYKDPYEYVKLVNANPSRGVVHFSYQKYLDAILSRQDHMTLFAGKIAKDTFWCGRGKMEKLTRKCSTISCQNMSQDIFYIFGCTPLNSEETKTWSSAWIFLWQMSEVDFWFWDRLQASTYTAHPYPNTYA